MRRRDVRIRKAYTRFVRCALSGPFRTDIHAHAGARVLREWCYCVGMMGLIAMFFGECRPRTDVISPSVLCCGLRRRWPAGRRSCGKSRVGCCACSDHHSRQGHALRRCANYSLLRFLPRPAHGLMSPTVPCVSQARMNTFELVSLFATSLIFFIGVFTNGAGTHVHLHCVALPMHGSGA